MRRERNIRAICEGIAQRGPWGHIVRTEDPVTKAVIKTRVSYQGILRLLALTECADPAPRADKGASYKFVQLNKKRPGLTRFIVREA